jgi:hypothetical protein
MYSRSARFQTVVIDQNPLRLYLAENLQEEVVLIQTSSFAFQEQ